MLGASTAPPRSRPRQPSLPVALVLGFLGLKLAVLITNLAKFPTLCAAGPHLPPPTTALPARVALLVPFRNEAAVIPRTVPGLLAAGFDEVVFLDDESTDDGAGLLAAVLAHRKPGGPPARVVSGAFRPPDWAGKTWACAQLGTATAADVLVFCDCDVDLASGAAVALLAEMRRQRSDVFSVFCRQRVGSWSERLLTPLITDVVLCFLPFALLDAPVRSAATASGALLAFRRSAYEGLGGFAAVRSELVEDVAMARRTRRAGLKLGLALGGDVAGVRMYAGYREVVAGLGRGLVPAVGGRRALVVAGWCWHVLAYTMPVLLARRSGWWLLAAGLGSAERMLVEAKTGGRDWIAAVMVCLSPLAAGPVVAQAVRRRQVWKGRTYG